MNLKLRKKLFAVGVSFVLLAGITPVFAGENAPKRVKRAEQPFDIKVKAWGASQAEIDEAKTRIERSTAVQNFLKGTKYRLISFNFLENETKTADVQPPTKFRIVFYDYTNDRTIVAEGDLATKADLKVREEFFQPVPNDEEFGEAAALLTKDARFTASLANKTLKSFRPMPPTTVLEGTNERLINVGLIADSSSNEVVSVSLKTGKVIRYDNGAPETSLAAPEACGNPDSGQGASTGGLAGQYQVTIQQNQTTLWEMLVIRPSASTGTLASGVEIRNVKYKGKSVLKRGHVPVLNVEYVGNACGPYRDWQYAEGFFNAPEANSINPAPGIRVLAPGQVATTVIETGNDTGNFQGVAIYQQNVGLGNETVMVSEVNAGWYRYIMEWRFADDGTIRPRFGFGGINNACVCNVHNHHAYWRLDFDIVNPLNKVFQIERGRKFMQPITMEINRNKNHQTRRSWMIQNATGDEAYMLVPNLSDGIVDEFGRNDLWILRYKNVPNGNELQNEFNDGFTGIGGACTPTSGSCINITKFVNGESVDAQDVVVWYGAHFIHNDGSNLLDPNRSGQVLTGTHVVGPDIRPVRW